MSDHWRVSVGEWCAQHAEEIKAMYSQLHGMAETSWQEHETTAYITRHLEALGLRTTAFTAHTGAIGAWDGPRAGRTVALRADIDALWQSVDGEWRANHSCGHDAHMTMVYSAVRCLKEIGYALPAGRLLAVFQPAEEVAEGALALVRSGALDEVDCMLGIHVRPQLELEFGRASSAIYHGGVAHVHGRIKGRQAHAARPEAGANAIEAFAAIVTAIQAIRTEEAQSGNGTAGESCKVTVARIPNESVNLIPDEVEFVVDIRAATRERLIYLAERVQKAAEQAGHTGQAGQPEQARQQGQVGQPEQAGHLGQAGQPEQTGQAGHPGPASGIEVQAQWSIKASPAIPNAYMEQVVGNAIEQVLGPQGWAPPVVTPGAEDFHFYPAELGSLQATMVGLGSGLSPGLHHPQMAFNLDALAIGTSIMALAAIQLLEE